jgi:hypothetical protein
VNLGEREDGFSSSGTVEYKAASVGGKETDLKEVERNLHEVTKIIAEGSPKRDRAKKT